MHCFDVVAELIHYKCLNTSADTCWETDNSLVIVLLIVVLKSKKVKLGYIIVCSGA